jgi:hypothetical protein
MNANELTDMNVNKLADDLERASSDMEYNIHVSDWALLFESAVVLRKQQAEIEAFEKFITDNQARTEDFAVWLSIQK